MTNNTEFATKLIVNKMVSMLRKGFTRNDCKKALEVAEYNIYTIFWLMDLVDAEMKSQGEAK